MSWFDLAFLMLTLFSVIVGAWRGFVFELISLLGWAAGFWVALNWGAELGALIPWQSIGDDPKRVLGMVAAFILAMFVSSLLASSGRKSIKALGMRSADRVLGAGFGVLRVLIVGVMLAIAVSALQWQYEPWWDESSISEPLELLRLELARMLPHLSILQPAPVTPISVPLGLDPLRF